MIYIILLNRFLPDNNRKKGQPNVCDTTKEHSNVDPKARETSQKVGGVFT